MAEQISASQLRGRLLRRPWLWITLGSVLVVLVVAVCAGLIARDAESDPARVVQRYLSAIARGDAATANGMIDLDADTGAALMSADDLRSARTRIVVGAVETEKRESGRAVVRAEFSLAGEKYEREFALEAGPPGPFAAERWALRTPLLGVSIVEVRAEVPDIGRALELTIGARRVPVDVGGERTPARYAVVAGYPAVYDASLDAGGFFEPSSDRLTIAPADARSGDRQIDILLGSRTGRIQDPELALKLPFSRSFAETVVGFGRNGRRLRAEPRRGLRGAAGRDR